MAALLETAQAERDSENTGFYHDGLDRGREEGMARGMDYKALEIAKALLKKGLPLEIAAECTGLSIEQIESLVV